MYIIESQNNYNEWVPFFAPDNREWFLSEGGAEEKVTTLSKKYTNIRFRYVKYIQEEVLITDRNQKAIHLLEDMVVKNEKLLREILDNQVSSSDKKIADEFRFWLEKASKVIESTNNESIFSKI